MERFFNWTGILIEADQDSFQNLLSRNRNVWSLPVCLSVKPYPTMVCFKDRLRIEELKEKMETNDSHHKSKRAIGLPPNTYNCGLILARDQQANQEPILDQFHVLLRYIFSCFESVFSDYMSHSSEKLLKFSKVLLKSARVTKMLSH